MSLKAALAAHAQGRRAEALDMLKAMGPAAADDTTALQLWSVLLDPAQSGEALALLEQAVRVAPGEAQAHFNLGVALQTRGELDRAVLRYQQALALAPRHLDALNNLSDLLRRRSRSEEGWETMGRFLAGGGSPRGQELRLAKLALDTRRLDEAGRWFEAASAQAPRDPRVAWEHAMFSLLMEDWTQGWARYEARLEVFGLSGLGIFPHDAPRWQGEGMAGKTLLLHREQGLGDMIMFAAAVPGLIAEGAKVHLAVPPALTRLFAASFPGARAWTSLTTLGEARQPPQPWLRAVGSVDFQAPLASLGALRMAAGPPAPVAYITAPLPDVAVWAQRLEALAPRRSGERRIGLVIGARRPGLTDDGFADGVRKSVPAALAGALADVPRARWFALHDAPGAAMLADIPRLAFCDVSPWLTDLADTAAAIANLDLVVSVDTAAAHLAAAMGKPVILLLAFGADWRWGHGRSDSAFYGGVTIVRQGAPDDWTGALQATVGHLS